MIAPSADVDSRASIASSASVWHLAQVREDAQVGENCIIGRGAYIDAGVVIGDNCKVQNGAFVYAPARVADGVFIGPGVIFTNDTFPRAVNPDGSLKKGDDWEMTGVVVRKGASIGAGSVILGGVEIGEWALIAAGSVVTKDVPPYALMRGTPARRVGWVGPSGRSLVPADGELVDEGTGMAFIEEDERLKSK